MTAFTSADLPPSINTVEKLIIWSTTLVSDLYRDTSVIEASGQAERVAQASPFLFTATDPSVWRYVSRISLELEPNWRRTGKVWQYAKDIGTIAIPSDYKA